MPAVSSRGRGRRTINEINMVPFIDVMLVLLIIFMVTAPLITPSQIELPTVGQASAPPKTYVQVVIDKEELLRIRLGSASGDGDGVAIGQLAAGVRQLQGMASEAGGPAPVVISADRNVKYDAVVKVMDTLQRAGIERVGLSVQPSR